MMDHSKYKRPAIVRKDRVTMWTKAGGASWASRRHALWISLFLLVMLTQASLSPASKKNLQIFDSVAREISSGIAKANSLMRVNPRKSVAILRDLDARFPDRCDVLLSLGQAYQTVGEVDSAMGAYKRCLRIDGRNLRAGKALGMLYLSEGENESARVLSDRIIEENNHSMAAYHMMGSAAADMGLYDQALRIYNIGRNRSEHHYALTLPIAHLEAVMGNSQAAFSEYLNYVERFPQDFQVAEAKIIELFDSAGERRDELVRIAEERSLASRSPSGEILDILSAVYLRMGLLERSLEAALEANRLRRSDGKTLFAFAERIWGEYDGCAGGEKRRYFDLCIRALEALTEGHPKAPYTPRAMLLHAGLLADAASGAVSGFSAEGRAHALDEAVEALDEIIGAHWGIQEAELAALKKGDILFEIRKQPREALDVYRWSWVRARFMPGVFAEKVGRMYLALSEYDRSQRHFAGLIRSAGENLHEMGVYYTGLLFGFKGEYGPAVDTLTTLARANPTSPFTNDAIELAWIIEEGRSGSEDVLALYMQALKAELAGDTAAVLGNLEHIVRESPRAPLRARALYKLGGMCAKRGDFKGALSYFQRFLDDYPKDDFRPDVHRAIARVYEYGFGNPDLALKEYEGILMRYPQYIFLDDIRADILRLKNRSGVN